MACSRLQKITYVRRSIACFTLPEAKFDPKFYQPVGNELNLERLRGKSPSAHFPLSIWPRRCAWYRDIKREM